MYSAFQLAAKYARYYFTASNGKGHGVHSPFVFEFISSVLRDSTQYPCYNNIEQQRIKLQHNNTVIEVEDFGAGSSVIRSNKRVIKDIARSSLKPKKFAQLLFRMVQFYKPAAIIELGTSLGITSAYLSSANPAAKLYTCEGSEAIAAVAQQQFNVLHLSNIQLVKGDFDHTLDPLLKEVGKADFVFIDGNHRKQPTLDYFAQLLQHGHEKTIFVFDDIHWSSGMEEAWLQVQQHPSVTLTIDLFFIGIVLINPDFRERQHFTIRF